MLEDRILEEGPDTVLAFMVEPVGGASTGALVPPAGYMQRIRQICDHYGVLLIHDEVMSGGGRTGRFFGAEHWDVVPDIMTTAKGCTSAYTPLGITATTKDVGDFFEDEFFCHGHTYAYHALCLSAVKPAVEEYKKLVGSGLPQKVAGYLKEKLYELGEKHPCVGDVRGLGHFYALEIVKNRETREPFDVKADKLSGKPLMTAKISGNAMQNGLYVVAWYDTLTIAPPLIITEAEVDEAIAILDKALEIGDADAVKTDVSVSRSTEF
jgi:taurine--2-oxoglutarate transaminase